MLSVEKLHTRIIFNLRTKQYQRSQDYTKSGLFTKDLMRMRKTIQNENK